MRIEIDKSFEKDLSKIKDQSLREKVAEVIEHVLDVDHRKQIQKLKKLQGFENYYRIKLGDYRIGIEIEKSPENTGEEIVTFIRFIHRKDIYRYFP